MQLTTLQRGQATCPQNRILARIPQASYLRATAGKITKLRVTTALLLAGLLLVMALPNVLAAQPQMFPCDICDQLKLDDQPAQSFSWAAPTLLSPEDGDMVAADPCHCWNNDFALKWEQHSNASSYDLNIALDEDFIVVVLEQTEYKPPDEESPSCLITDGSLGAGSCGTTFYWKVRAVNPGEDSPTHSNWSETRSFTVEPGPATTIHLTAPCNGATNVPITNVSFTWSSVPHATSYNFTFSANSDLSSPIVAETGLIATAYTYVGTLEYQTPYYWQLSALKDGNIIATSSTVTFTTEAPPPLPPPELTTPFWLWAVIGVSAVLVILVVVLVFRTKGV